MSRQTFQLPEGFEKRYQVSLPFDRRHDDDGKNYGIGGLRVWFILKGPKGAVQFLVGFGIYLPHLYPEYAINHPGALKPEISGWDVGYHALEPQYEGQSPMGECDIFDGKPCYYDGSGLRGEKWANELFSIRGEPIEEHLWPRLLEYYRDRFEREHE